MALDIKFNVHIGTVLESTRVVMGVGAKDSDKKSLTSNAEGDGSERESSTAGIMDQLQTNSSAANTRQTSMTTRRRWFATVAASASLLFLLFMLSGGFCIWTMMRLSLVEARLERLERIRRTTINNAVEPSYDAGSFAQHLSVCTVIIFVHLP